MRILKETLSVMLLTALCGGLALAGNEEARWNVGFGRRQIPLPEESGQMLYIAGYNNGYEIDGVLDLCEARAVWLDTGSDGVLLIGIDCVALDSGTVGQIREALSDIPNCAAINVYATHTHAGPDTLGLWGPIGQNGKNDAYMAALVKAAEEAAREAAENRVSGTLHFGLVETKSVCHDSRLPEVFDENLYQLRFAPDGESAGLRMYFYGAHAESLRGANRKLSRDFPGMLCDGMTEFTGDNTMFLPGAIGGLIMTKEFVGDTTRGAVQNLEKTAEELLSHAKAITPEVERELAPEMSLACRTFSVPLDNPVFLMYRTLGILNNRAVPAESATGFGVETELSVLMLGDVALALIPGEIFPELVLGGTYGDANPDGVNPRPLKEIAQEHGIETLLIVGLCNDEVGYIVPPSDFLLNENAPYIQRTMDYKHEDHYEETNSVGPDCAQAVADAFEAAVRELK